MHPRTVGVTAARTSTDVGRGSRCCSCFSGAACAMRALPAGPPLRACARTSAGALPPRTRSPLLLRRRAATPRAQSESGQRSVKLTVRGAPVICERSHRVRALTQASRPSPTVPHLLWRAAAHAAPTSRPHLTASSAASRLSLPASARCRGAAHGAWCHRRASSWTDARRALALRASLSHACSRTQSRARMATAKPLVTTPLRQRRWRTRWRTTPSTSTSPAAWRRSSDAQRSSPTWRPRSQRGAPPAAPSAA